MSVTAAAEAAAGGGVVGVVGVVRVLVVVVVVVVVVVGAPPYQLCWLIFPLPELWGEGGGGGRGRIIAYKPTSTSQLPPNLMPSFKFYN